MSKKTNTKSILGFHKTLALTLSDQLSAFTKTDFNIQAVEVDTKKYNQFLHSIDHLTYVSLYKMGSRGMVLVVNGALVKLLTNKTLGGLGDHDSDKALTFSETIMAKEMTNWILKYYNIHNIDYKFERDEQNTEHIHYFYPDEEVALLNFKTEIDGNYIGNITICQPIENLCLEPDPWLA